MHDSRFIQGQLFPLHATTQINRKVVLVTYSKRIAIDQYKHVT